MTMDEGARLWLLKTCHKQYWRVARTLDLDDLIQEGYMVFYKVVAKYPEVKNPAHIMSLFKVSFLNHMHNLAKHTRLVEVLADDLVFPAASDNPIDTDSVWDKIMGSEFEAATLRVLIGQAPEPVKAVLGLLAQEDGRRRLQSAYRIKNGQRETFNQRLCRLTGLDHNQFDLVTAVKDYFS